MTSPNEQKPERDELDKLIVWIGKLVEQERKALSTSYEALKNHTAHIEKRWLVCLRELQNANKGIERLRRKWLRAKAAVAECDHPPTCPARRCQHYYMKGSENDGYCEQAQEAPVHGEIVHFPELSHDFQPGQCVEPCPKAKYGGG